MSNQVIYYRDRRGVEPVRRYIDDLQRVGCEAESARILRDATALEEYGLGLLGIGLVRLIDPEARIYELRSGNHRVAFAESEGAWVLLCAWRKQTRKLDRREAGRARSNLADWRSRAGR